MLRSSEHGLLHTANHRALSTSSPYEVLSRRPLSQAVSHYVTTCLRPNPHLGSLRGKERLFWGREPQAGRKAATAAVPGVPLPGTQRCSPARPSHAGKGGAWGGSVTRKCSCFQKKMQVGGFAQETAWGRGKEAECLSLTCKVKCSFSARAKTPRGDDFLRERESKTQTQNACEVGPEKRCESHHPLLSLADAAARYLLVLSSRWFWIHGGRKSLSRFNESRNDASRNPSKPIPACPKHA